MKKRYAGGMAVAVFALGFWLSQFWNFGGLGTGEKEGTSPLTSSPSASEGETREPVDLDDVAASSDVNSTVGGMAGVPAKQAEKYITVAIHEDRYRLTTEADPGLGLDVSLNEVVRQTKAATGGEQGVKLRILFARNAQEGARADLHAALQKEDVKREEIQEISGYID